MQVFRGISAPPCGPIALTIGNFDGLHLGHQAMLARLVGAAHERRLPATVMTFEPHPAEFFAPLRAPARLSSLREKLELMRGYSVDRVHVLRFDQAFAQTSAEDFVTALLHKKLATRWLLVGDDFRWGAKRSQRAIWRRHRPISGGATASPGGLCMATRLAAAWGFRPPTCS